MDKFLGSKRQFGLCSGLIIVSIYFTNVDNYTKQVITNVKPCGTNVIYGINMIMYHSNNK